MFSALFHHLGMDRLREAQGRLKPNAAAGVDGLRRQEYGGNLEGNLHDLHDRLPARERALLVAWLWESVEDPYAFAADLSDEDVLALAQARDAELEDRTVAPISQSDLMSRLMR